MAEKRKSGKLTGKVALITGGGGGIGGAIAKLFAAEGARVAVLDLSETAAKKAAAAIIRAGSKAIALEGDVSDPDAARRSVKATISAFGKLHILVNVAAARDVKRGTVVDMELENWNRTLAVNITGPFLMCKYAIPHMKKVRGASIINVASQLGIIGVPSRIHYCTSKAALIHFSKVLAMDHAKDKIRVNALSPGAVDTPNALKTYKSRAESIRRRGPQYLMGEPGLAEEIAAGALFLASDECKFMNAGNLVIDGGYTAFKGNKENAPSPN
jgi:NAD(P)-dependent dehydrogenase (short-subunit alcohol dehydrogenase family)